MLCLIMYKVRSENGYGFLRPGLKTGMGNGIFWSEIGSEFGDAGGTPPPKIPRSNSPGKFKTVLVFRNSPGPFCLILKPFGTNIHFVQQL